MEKGEKEEEELQKCARVPRTRWLRNEEERGGEGIFQRDNIDVALKADNNALTMKNCVIRQPRTYELKLEEETRIIKKSKKDLRYFHSRVNTETNIEQTCDL